MYNYNSFKTIKQPVNANDEYNKFFRLQDRNDFNRRCETFSYTEHILNSGTYDKKIISGKEYYLRVLDYWKRKAILESEQTIDQFEQNSFFDNPYDEGINNLPIP